MSIVEEFLPKRKIIRAENHKDFQKEAKKATKRRQKSDKLSLFQILSVAFCRPLKKASKSDKRRQFVAFSFVGAHPREAFHYRCVTLTRANREERILERRKRRKIHPS